MRSETPVVEMSLNEAAAADRVVVKVEGLYKRVDNGGEPLTILHDNRFEVAAGESVAIVGASGSGKSTLTKLIQRLYDLEGGRILIDGQDVAHVDQGALRRGIAVVPQDPALFHRTIAESTNNPHFLALIEFLFNFLIKATLITRSYEATKLALSQQVKEEHLLIVDAISRQDSEAARQAARQHMEGASRRLGSVDLKRFIAQNENLDSA